MSWSKAQILKSWWGNGTMIIGISESQYMWFVSWFKTKLNSTLQNDVCLFWKWISAGISIHCGKSYELQLVPESYVSCSTTGATLNRDMLRDPISKRLAGVILLHLFIFHVTLLHCFFVNPPPPHTHSVFLILPAYMVFCTLSPSFFPVFGPLV